MCRGYSTVHDVYITLNQGHFAVQPNHHPHRLNSSRSRGQLPLGRPSNTGNFSWNSLIEVHFYVLQNIGLTTLILNLDDDMGARE